jgi:hypothetical protein
MVSVILVKSTIPNVEVLFISICVVKNHTSTATGITAGRVHRLFLGAKVELLNRKPK